MGGFVSYVVQSAIIMTLLYLAYKWLLSTSTFHKMNRVVLLFIYAVSWSLPMILSLIHSMNQGNAEIELGIPIAIGLDSDMQEPSGPVIDWWRILLWIYIIGMSVTLIVTVTGIIRMIGIIKKGNRMSTEGYTFVTNEAAPGPFSWGKYIVIRPSDKDESYSMIISHEKTHLKLYHWLDLIPAQITTILQWFSPASWLMMRELKDVHEYQVDIIAGGEDSSDYQLMLLKKTVSSSFPGFADSLNQSQIKKRLTMMMKKKSNPSRKLAVFSLPAAAILGVLSLSIPMIAGVVENIASATVRDFSENKISYSDGTMQIPETSFIQNDNGKSGVQDEDKLEEKSLSSVAESESQSLLSESEEIKDKDSAKEKSAQRTYFLDGKLFTGSLNDLDPNDIVSISVVKNDPEYPEKIMIVTKKAASDRNENKLYLLSTKVAEFKGGQKGLMEFLIENIKYPTTEKSYDKPIHVIVQFTIDKDGNVTDEKIVKKGLPQDSEEFDAEALRVLKLTSGRWEPARNDGVAVASQFTLPVTFKVKTGQ